MFPLPLATVYSISGRLLTHPIAAKNVMMSSKMNQNTVNYIYSIENFWKRTPPRLHRPTYILGDNVCYIILNLPGSVMTSSVPLKPKRPNPTMATDPTNASAPLEYPEASLTHSGSDNVNVDIVAIKPEVQTSQK